MPNVYELTRGYQNITQGNPLIFPNVLTCMAFVAHAGATLIGVHFTIADQSTARVTEAWTRVQAISAGAHAVYVAGPGWNASLLANLVPAPASVDGVLSIAGSDIQATLAHGVVTLTYRANGTVGAWLPLL
ncbi:MAG TPA: hypothetical protein VHZ52_08490 [Acidobacteriaceae bacterium]|jgi:hypothetical protein|nr:hypothetical protein [Acidobacteriaceae bacterium]